MRFLETLERGGHAVSAPDRSTYSRPITRAHANHSGHVPRPVRIKCSAQHATGALRDRRLWHGGSPLHDTGAGGFERAGIQEARKRPVYSRPRRRASGWEDRGVRLAAIGDVPGGTVRASAAVWGGVSKTTAAKWIAEGARSASAGRDGQSHCRARLFAPHSRGFEKHQQDRTNS